MVKIENFCKTFNLTLDEYYGLEVIERDLRFITALEIPNNFSPIIKGDLDLRHVRKIGSGFSPTVYGYLNLGNILEIPSDSKINAETIDIRKLKILPEGVIINASKNLYIKTITEINYPIEFNMVGNLDARNVLKINSKIKGNIRGYVNLNNLEEVNSEFNINIGKNLYVRDLNLKSLGDNFNPIVEGGIYSRVD